MKRCFGLMVIAAAFSLMVAQGASAASVRVSFGETSLDLDTIETSETLAGFYDFGNWQYRGSGELPYSRLIDSALNVFAVQASDGLGLFSVYKKESPFAVDTSVTSELPFSVPVRDDTGGNDDYVADSTYFYADQYTSGAPTDGFVVSGLAIGQVLDYTSDDAPAGQETADGEFDRVVFYTGGGFEMSLPYDEDETADFDATVVPSPAAATSGLAMLAALGVRAVSRRRRRA
ncbi:MAG: hypothetical protein ACOCTI_05735 [Phycisphaeraceae bacterium]